MITPEYYEVHISVHTRLPLDELRVIVRTLCSRNNNFNATPIKVSQIVGDEPEVILTFRAKSYILASNAMVNVVEQLARGYNHRAVDDPIDVLRAKIEAALVDTKFMRVRKELNEREADLSKT